MSASHLPLSNLDACAREPIHIPGSIQPHGALLTLREPDLTVVQASSNTGALLGHTPADLIGSDFRTLLQEKPRRQFDAAVAQDDPGRDSPLPLVIGDRLFDALLHRTGGLIVVELEPSPGGENFSRHHRLLQAGLQTMYATDDLLEIYASMARIVSELTGFERVMVYRFDADWHGEVVGEVLTAPVDSYMGLHFPASDIPEQARALYARTWLRIIPNVDYTPASLEPSLNPITNHPLDLSACVLRSVSPVHLEYLRNMDVRASMSISLIVEGKLWGLIACHHGAPRYLPYAVRAAGELFGQVASAAIAATEKSRRLAERAQVKGIQTRLFDFIAQEDSFADALLRYAPSLLEFMNADGVAISIGNQCNLVGSTPPRECVVALVEWLSATKKEDPVFATNSLSGEWPPAADWKDVASGLLAVKLSRVESHWVLWFRPEVQTTVTWAGNPAKPVEPGLRLHPRKSFAAWKEIVLGRSRPWNEPEIDGAHELRLAMNALVIRRSERLLKLNQELERKNSDLNSFAYIASHDLKEPLRGIFHFARFLREDHAAELGPEGLRKVDNIAAMAAHTNELIVALAHFSQVGRMELKPRPSDLEKVVDEVLTSLSTMLEESNVEIRRPRTLPEVTCDPVLVREVFANLISNAAKYNSKTEKWVEISYRDPEPGQEARGPVFTVRDNGIGVRDRNFEAVFQMFRRLNKEEFGSGTGAGLAIVKSIVNRHGGNVWIESTLGEGTTFVFTLA